MTDGLCTARLLAGDVLGMSLGTADADSPLAPAMHAWRLAGGGEVGVWEAGPGTDTDVEEDEVFVVLAGAGSVTFQDGSSLELRPGVVVRLVKGDRTSWDITQRLRKLYVAT